MSESPSDVEALADDVRTVRSDLTYVKTRAAFDRLLARLEQAERVNPLNLRAEALERALRKIETYGLDFMFRAGEDNEIVRIARAALASEGEER